MVSSRFLSLAAIVTVACAQAAAARLQGQRPLDISVLPTSLHPGDVARVEVPGTSKQKPPILTIATLTSLNGHIDFYFDEPAHVWRALVGIDLATSPAVHDMQIRLADPERIVTQSLRIQPKQFPVRRLKVEPGYVEPSPEALAQIARDNAALSGAYARQTSKLWTGAFRLPVDGVPTSNFGSRSYYNGQPRAPHAGIDFRSGPGTPVRAANHGTIVLAQEMYFTGNTVVVDHGARLLSVFAHLSEMHVKAGDIVTPEAIVGLVGATGRVTGPHLHWSVRLNGARVDPLSLVAATKALDP
jgi:murein DD-endopeptidase MepM/ murein hydrolase activator NlpD